MAAFGGLIPQNQSQQTQQTMTYRILAYKYGNGYEAMLPDGANAQIDTWTISFDNLGAAQSVVLTAWLQASPPWVLWAGDGVILPAANSYSVTTDGWQVTPMPGNVNAFTFNIAQRF
jgi:phage-related protein